MDINTIDRDSMMCISYIQYGALLCCAVQRTVTKELQYSAVKGSAVQCSKRQCSTGHISEMKCSEVQSSAGKNRAVRYRQVQCSDAVQRSGAVQYIGAVECSKGLILIKNKKYKPYVPL